MNEPPDIMHYTNSYILSTQGSGEGKAGTYLRKEQVLNLLGPHASFIDSLPAAMVLTVPTAEGTESSPIYSWHDVHALLVKVGRATK